MKNSKSVFILLFFLACVINFGCSSGSSSKMAEPLETGWYFVGNENTENAVEKIRLQSTDTVFLNPTPIVTLPDFKEIFIYSGFTNQEGLQLILNEQGAIKWAEATKSYVQKYLGFVIDDQLIHTQRIASKIEGGISTINEKWFDKKYLEETAAKINLQIAQGQK